MKKGTTEITYMNWGASATILMRELNHFEALEYGKNMVAKFGGSFSYKLI